MCRRLEYVHNENHLSFIKAFSWRADDLNKIWDLEIFIGIYQICIQICIQRRILRRNPSQLSNNILYTPLLLKPYVNGLRKAFDAKSSRPDWFWEIDLLKNYDAVITSKVAGYKSANLLK